MADTYCITRYYQNGEPVITRRGLSVKEATSHCQNPETSSATATDPKLDERGPWFDGFAKEK